MEADSSHIYLAALSSVVDWSSCGPWLQYLLGNTNIALSVGETLNPSKWMKFNLWVKLF